MQSVILKIHLFNKYIVRAFHEPHSQSFLKGCDRNKEFRTVLAVTTTFIFQTFKTPSCLKILLKSSFPVFQNISSHLYMLTPITQYILRAFHVPDSLVRSQLKKSLSNYFIYSNFSPISLFLPVSAPHWFPTQHLSSFVRILLIDLLIYCLAHWMMDDLQSEENVCTLQGLKKSLLK